MKYPRYPKYKDSGVEWLGDVPEGWEVASIKHLGKLKGGAGFPHEEQGLDDQALPFHKVNALSAADHQGFISTKENTISIESAKKLGAFIFPEKSIVFAKVGAALLLARICRILQKSCIDNNMMGFIPESGKVNNDYIASAFNIIKFDYIVNPGAVPSLNEAQIGNVLLPLPSLSDQQTIAAFLDHNCAKIDALIAEQEKLIALLREKRQAVISHAVTKGLNPDAPMKDSGVEWLGEVPEGWEVKRLQQLNFDLKAGPFGSSLTKDMYTETGFKVYGQEQVIANDFSIGDYYITQDIFKDLEQYSICKKDILISCVGTFGKIAVVPEYFENGIINPRLIRLRIRNNMRAEYIAISLRSSVVFEQLSLLSRGGTMDVVNIGIIKQVYLVIPPLPEQQAIVAHLDAETTKIDALITESEKAVTLLKERRSALVSAAVTGKIDVRDIPLQEAV